MKKSIFLSGVTVIALLAFFAGFAVEKDSSELVILYSNNTNGDLKHCGCPGNPHGSLSVRLGEINRIRRQGLATLLLDGGDIFPPLIDDDLKLTYALRMMEKMGYDGVALGDQDFGKGFPEAKAFLRSGRLPYLAANVFDATTKELIAPKGWMRKMAGTVSCLVIGVVSKSAYQFFPNELKDTMDQIEIKDPASAIRAILERERRPDDLVVILSHMGAEEDKLLAQTLKGIQVIVGGHSQTKLANPIRENGVLIVQAGKYSNYLGQLKVSWNNGRIGKFSNELISLGDHMKGDPDLEVMHQEYQSTLKQVNVWSGKLGKPYQSTRCQTCHESAFKVWSGSRHAHALESIHHDSRARTKDCLYCHTTMIQDATIRDAKEIPMKVAADIQCMACHQVEFEPDAMAHKLPVAPVGGGTLKTKDFCMKCHTQRESPGFNFEKYWKKIKHGKEGEGYE